MTHTVTQTRKPRKFVLVVHMGSDTKTGRPIVKRRAVTGTLAEAKAELAAMMQGEGVRSNG